MQCSISLKFYLQFCFLPLAVLGNKHILFVLASFAIAHKNNKMCLLTDCLLPCFRYPQDQKHILAQNGKVEDQAMTSLEQDDITLSSLAWPGH